MTKSVGVHAAKTHLSRLLEAVEAGEEVEITRRGVTVARLVPPRPGVRRLVGDQGLVVIHDDFDAPLPDELLAAFEGG